MKLLVSKREANLPLFLSLACEELRVFGVFEQVCTFNKKYKNNYNGHLCCPNIPHFDAHSL